MPGPWEQYQSQTTAQPTQDGPWGKYQPKAQAATPDAPRPSGPQEAAPARLPGVLGDINDFGNNLGDAVAHHLVNLPLGLAQLGMHGASATADMVSGDTQQSPTGEQAQRGGAAGAIDKSTAALDSYIKRREDAYQKDVPTNTASTIGAGIGEVLPWVTGIGELRAAGMIPAATTTIGKLGALAVEGGAMGAATPTTGDGSFAGQKAVQVATGAATGPALYGAGKAAGGVADAARYLTSPQTVADSILAKQFGADPSIIAKLRQAPQFVPGEAPSVAQVLQTPEAVKAERAIRNSPNAAAIMDTQDNANNKARQAVVSRLAGDDQQMQDAIKSRRDATQPWRDANLPAEGSALADPADIVKTLEKLSLSGNDTIRGAARKHLALIEDHAKQNGGKIPVTDLEDIRQGVGSTLASIPQNGAVTPKEVALYAPLSDQIANTIERVAPGYRDYLAAYAKHSEPINTMESVQKLADPNAPGSLNAAGDPQLAISRLRQVLRGDDKARYPMSDQARKELDAVRDSLLRRTISDNKVAASGPGTAADLQHSKIASLIFGDPLGGKAGPLSRMIGSAAGTGLGSMLLGPAGGYMGAAAGAMLPEAAQKVTGRIASRVGESAADSRKTADAIERYLKKSGGKSSKGMSALSQLLLGTSP